jgi:subtilase family serine protease
MRAQALASVVAAALAAALTLTSASGVTSPRYGHMSAPPAFSPPQTVKPGSMDEFSCQSAPIDGSLGPRCYAPQQLQQAYGYSGLLASGVDGRGKTIVIVAAFANPDIQQDLQIEDGRFGLPAPPSFTIISPAGNPPPFDFGDDDQLGWAGETSLDVQAAHAMAPAARILLVEAASDDDSDLYAAEKYVVDHHLGDVMTQSFGAAETCVDSIGKWQSLLHRATREGWTLFAPTGDSGAAQFSCDGNSAILAPSFPASDPDVTGVGGTTLDASDPDGDYLGETAWTEPLFGCNPPALDFPFDVNCSGGGYSTVFGRPSWQRSMVKGGGRHAGRGVPDVAYDAGVNGGLLIHVGVYLQAFYGLDPSTPEFFVFGGTSAGSPQWAALAADADQLARHDLGNINEELYHLAQAPPKYAANFHDVTTGNNDVAEIGGQGYDAGSGWDAVTGLGTPNAANLLPALAKER